MPMARVLSWPSTMMAATRRAAEVSGARMRAGSSSRKAPIRRRISAETKRTTSLAAGERSKVMGNRLPDAALARGYGRRPRLRRLLGGGDLGQQVVDGGCYGVEEDRGVDAHQDGDDDQRREGHDLVQPHVGQDLQVVLGQVAEDDPAVEPEHVAGREDHADGGEEGEPARVLEGAD